MSCDDNEPGTGTTPIDPADLDDPEAIARAVAIEAELRDIKRRERRGE